MEMELVSIVREGLPPGKVLSWDYDETDAGYTWSFEFSHMEFKLYTDHLEQPLMCEVWDKAYTVPRKVIDPLRAAMRSLFFGSSALTQTLDSSYLPVQLERRDLAFLIWQASNRKVKGKRRWAVDGWDVSEVKDWNVILRNPAGLDASTIVDTASNILGQTPQQIHEVIPAMWRVLHIESIMRPDLAERFLGYQKALRRRLEKYTSDQLCDRLPPHSDLSGRVRTTIPHKELIEDLVKPRVTFHGTTLANVSSIIRCGFKLPGNIVDGKVVASPRTGVVYNRGIYSSEQSWYAMSYAKGEHQATPLGEIPSMRLFVCATVMGRTLAQRKTITGGGPNVHGPLVDGYDAHFDGGHEYIAYNEAAMLPCYVIHLDMGSEAAAAALRQAQANSSAFAEAELENIKARNKARADPRMAGIASERYKSPGDVQREKEAKKAAALKWFPYGFGSASGTNFVIEDVGATSDDEEEYGEWQADKHALTAPPGKEFEYVKGEHLMDQYQGARFAPSIKSSQLKKVVPDDDE
ncbi:hypothetical protein B0H63DRAFT_440336 [Podospora didyma]|uniref:PARP catalytic domain-containing protein n=1 Tax=Podospora didyma TaxID=330526 RepID=A0AAE0K5I2_9PEZI|nr:hypothetical protein B0H63DRAFT_440336 [Podospora didyma]